MNSNNAVEQGAGVILCSAERAEALGVPRDRWVFPHSGTDAHDHYFVSNRYDLGSSPPLRLAGRAAPDLAGCGLDDLPPTALSPSFPSAVQTPASDLGPGLGPPRTGTVGPPSAGGPLPSACRATAGCSPTAGPTPTTTTSCPTATTWAPPPRCAWLAGRRSTSRAAGSTTSPTSTCTRASRPPCRSPLRSWASAWAAR